MKRFAFLLKSAFLAGIFALTFAGCSKDEDESSSSELNGMWVFRESNILFYNNGEVFNIKETDPSLLEEMNSGYSGLFFIFSDGRWYGGVDGQTYSTDAYTVSGDIITIKEDSDTFDMHYKVSGKNLDLTFDILTFETVIGVLPDEFYNFDGVEIILSFDKQD
ncbi:MAG: hypothetical protein LBK97_01625 [Prevotellaceae bacterium]|jgi:hypothetical protein|nr:hypothetical protein [Prevotellaceae bacterium]